MQRRNISRSFVALWCALVVGVGAWSVTLGLASDQTPANRDTVAKTWTPGRTPDGQPNLQGVWLNNRATPLERPDALKDKPFLSDQEVSELKKRAWRIFKERDADFAPGDQFFQAALTNVEQFQNPNATGGSVIEMIDREFDNRTSLIIDPPDGKVPWTPEGQQRQRAAIAAMAQPRPAGPEDLPHSLRCLTFGVPRLGGVYSIGEYSYFQIFQAAGYVVLLMEYAHEGRVIPIDGRPHLPESVRQLNGDSRGRWDGHTLVVDTTNFSPESFFMGSTENLHMTERFTRVNADTIHYDITVDDPRTWTRPWTAEIRLARSREPMFEVACHEGNFPVMTGMFAAARAKDKEGAAKTTKK
jgi:hypothetical protein